MGFGFVYFTSIQQIKSLLERNSEPKLDKVEQTKKENKTMEDNTNHYIFSAKDLENAFAPYMDKLVFREDKEDGSIHLNAKDGEGKGVYIFFHITQGVSRSCSLRLRVFGTSGNTAGYFLSLEDLENALKSAFCTELDKLKQILTEVKSKDNQ